MQSNLDPCTPSNVKILTKRLTFFGEDVLLQSTVTGKAGQYALDEHSLQTVVLTELTVECFREDIGRK